MGKKSKRIRSGNDAQSRPAPGQLKTEEETKDSLRFEDPFVDEVEEEDCMDDDADDEDAGGDDDEDAGQTEYIQSWHPLMGNTDGDETPELEMDPTAYKMHHSLTPDWPSLSFDFLRDDYGESRQRFPHTLWAAVGTQANTPEQNQLTIMQLSDLSKIPQSEEEDILGDEYDKPGKDGDDDSSDEEEDVDLDPVVEHYHLEHYGGVNRVRCMPQRSHIVATWSDASKVNVYNVKSILSRFSSSTAAAGGRKAASTMDDDDVDDDGNANSNNSKRPFFTHDATSEGYAMDWSSTQEGSLVTGNCHGTISLWKPDGDGMTSFQVTDTYTAQVNGKNASVEDLQWSPTETTVFAAATCDGTIQVYDTRAPDRPMLSPKIHDCDVNVMSWNRLVSNLLATGSDDGTLSVWDLRTFGKADKATPLARFTAHKTPITSVEWHPTDESMLGVTDDVGAYVYDLSVEEDAMAPASKNVAVADIPPQLLFCHAGSRLFKELHWHPQISSCMMTTALTGFSVFIPSNL